jgi:hypothetical protein
MHKWYSMQGKEQGDIFKLDYIIHSLFLCKCFYVCQSSKDNLFIFLLLCWVGVLCGIHKSSYSITKLSYLNSPPQSFSFISPPPIPGIVLTDLVFPFTYMCTQYLHYIHPPTPFPHILSSLPLVPTPTDRTCSAYLFSNFVKKKERKKEKMTFFVV